MKRALVMRQDSKPATYDEYAVTEVSGEFIQVSNGFHRTWYHKDSIVLLEDKPE